MKNRALKTLLFCLLIPALSGCQKTVFLRTAKGVVVDATTKEPIPFAQVSVYRETSEFLGPTRRELEASVFTNEKGEFEIKFHKTNQGANRIYAKKENYDEISGLSDDDVKEPKERKNVVLKLNPISNLKLIFKKNLDYKWVACEAILRDKIPYGRTMEFGDFEEDIKVNGNAITIFTITKKKIDVGYDITTDSIFCESNKTTAYLINF